MQTLIRCRTYTVCSNQAVPTHRIITVVCTTRGNTPCLQRGYLSNSKHPTSMPQQEKPYLLTSATNDDSNQRAFPQSLISFHFPQKETLHRWLSNMRPMKTFTRLHECTGLSESSVSLRMQRYVSDVHITKTCLFKYSRLPLSRPRLSRITACLEVKIWSLFLHGNQTTGNKILWSNFSSFPLTSGVKLQIHL